MNPITIVKSHPYLTAGAVVTVVVLVLLMSSSGGSNQDTSSAALVPASQDASAATALQIAQAQSAAQQYSVDAQKEVDLASLTTQEHLAQIDAQNQAAAIAAQYGLGQQQLLNESQKNTLDETLAAAQVKADVDKNALMYSTLQQQIISNQQIAENATAAQVKIAKNANKGGFLSSIFG